MKTKTTIVMSPTKWKCKGETTAEVTLAAGAGVDPESPAPVDPVLHEREPGLLGRGGIAYSEPPGLAPVWAPRARDGFLFADDLLSEGLALLLRGEDLSARAKLECSLAVLERMPSEGFSAAGMVGRLRDGLDLMRYGGFSEARAVFAPFLKEPSGTGVPRALTA